MPPAASAVASRRIALSTLILVYAGTIFLSAFLLFQVQPIIAKMILPWFGGTAAVWTTCMLFFQVVLLAGYLYAYCSVKYLSPKTQATLHLVLLGATLFLLPIVPQESWKPSGPGDPTVGILGLLSVTIGLPYLLLSTTGPLVQVWYARTRRGAPYRLFALSNAGSMLALVSYPAVVEPLLPATLQAQGWSAAYIVFAALCAAAAVYGFQGSSGAVSGDHPRAEAGESSPSFGTHALWVALAACASVLLLAVTNHLSKNVAPIPFLWVLPLSLYLLTFILSFEGRGWYNRDWYLKLLLVAFAGISYGLSEYGETASILVVISIFAAALFICCMVCHGELAALRPHPRHLTSFYLMCSLGGALGGVFTGLVAPYLFRGSFELAIGLVGCMFLPAVVLHRESTQRSPAQARQTRWAVVGMALGLALYLAIQIRNATGDAHLTVRNFYGVLRVLDSGPAGALDSTRTLTHGIVNHGEQFLHPDRRAWPTSYYGPQSGAGLAFRYARQGPRHVGVIGLGAGVLAAYGRAGDSFRFYEINPLVVELANSEFSFLRDTPAKVDVVLADGRLALEREGSQEFDVLVLDAFSGDSIPVHLLTREAFALYFRHLKPGGILAINASSTYLDLPPVIDLAMRDLGKESRLVTSAGDASKHLFLATWMLATDQREFFEGPELQKIAVRPAGRANLRMWTDDYSNLIRILR